MRHALFRLARDAGWAYATVQLGVQKSRRRERNTSSDRVPSETITQMARDLEPPDPRGWAGSASRLHSDRLEVLNAATELDKRARNPPRGSWVLQERAREAGRTGLEKHALDHARACVGEVASACAESLKKRTER